MDLASVINTMFSNFNQQFLEPIASGLWGIIPNTAVIAVIAAVLGLLVCFSPMQRGQKIGALVAIVVVAFAVPYLPQVISAILGGSTVDLGQAGSAAQSAASSAPAAASPAADPSAAAAPTLSGLSD